VTSFRFRTLVLGLFLATLAKVSLAAPTNPVIIPPPPTPGSVTGTDPVPPPPSAYAAGQNL